MKARTRVEEARREKKIGVSKKLVECKRLVAIRVRKRDYFVDLLRDTIRTAWIEIRAQLVGCCATIAVRVNKTGKFVSTRRRIFIVHFSVLHNARLYNKTHVNLINNLSLQIAEYKAEKRTIANRDKNHIYAFQPVALFII